MRQFTQLHGRAVVLPVPNVDTDQIIPARYLKATTKTGLGAGLFAGWRYRADGSPDPAFLLNRPEAEGAEVLVAGDNFGCGSSREHAVWALLDQGFRAVLAPRFADIFRNNSGKMGLVAATVDERIQVRVASMIALRPADSKSRSSASSTYPGAASATLRSKVRGTHWLNTSDSSGAQSSISSKSII